MTPTIALIAVCIIAAGLCVAVGVQQWRINQLNAENDRERARHKVTSELLTEARNEAKNEYELRRQAERNLADANDEVDTWHARAMRAENALGSVKVTRDPKTGRMVSTKSKPRPTAQEMERGLAEFDTSKAFQVSIDMRGGHTTFDAAFASAIEQLQGLTVRKLCDEVRDNTGSGI
jgi:cell division septation protein DedD